MALATARSWIRFPGVNTKIKKNINYITIIKLKHNRMWPNFRFCFALHHLVIKFEMSNQIFTLVCVRVYVDGTVYVCVVQYVCVCTRVCGLKVPARLLTSCRFSQKLSQMSLTSQPVADQSMCSQAAAGQLQCECVFYQETRLSCGQVHIEFTLTATYKVTRTHIFKENWGFLGIWEIGAIDSVMWACPVMWKLTKVNLYAN